MDYGVKPDYMERIQTQLEHGNLLRRAPWESNPKPSGNSADDAASGLYL